MAGGENRGEHPTPHLTACVKFCSGVGRAFAGDQLAGNARQLVKSWFRVFVASVVTGWDRASLLQVGRLLTQVEVSSLCAWIMAERDPSRVRRA